MFAILILQALTVQGGDNIEILPNPKANMFVCVNLPLRKVLATRKSYNNG